MRERRPIRLGGKIALGAVVVLGLAVGAASTLVWDVGRKEDELARVTAARRSAFEHQTWPRPVPEGRAREADATREILAAVARVRLSADEQRSMFRGEEPSAEMLARNTDALDSLARAATAVRMTGAARALEHDAGFGRALTLLFLRAQARDGAACLDDMLAIVRLSSDGFAFGRESGASSYLAALTSCVPRAQRSDVLRAAARARALVAGWPLAARREHDSIVGCESESRRLAQEPVRLWEWPRSAAALWSLPGELYARRDRVEKLVRACGAGGDPVRTLGAGAGAGAGARRGAADATFAVDRAWLRASVLALEAAAGQAPRHGDALTADPTGRTGSVIAVERGRDGIVEARAVGDVTGPIVVRCSPPAAAPVAVRAPAAAAAVALAPAGAGAAGSIPGPSSTTDAPAGAPAAP